MADSASFVKISHIAESGIAPAADNYSSPAVRRRPLLVADEPLHGEKLSVSSTEDSSPLKRGFLYGARELRIKSRDGGDFIFGILAAIWWFLTLGVLHFLGQFRRW